MGCFAYHGVSWHGSRHLLAESASPESREIPKSIFLLLYFGWSLKNDLREGILCLQIFYFLYITCSESALYVDSWLQLENVQPI